jgi:FtsP/CotA-like multicopper oxidase with cupredoxin domain
MSTKRLPAQASPAPAASRRRFLKTAGQGALATAGMGMLPFKKWLGPIGMAESQAAVTDPPNLYFAGTDGWISLPKSPAVYSASLGGVKTHPDDLAPDARFSTYIFGFRNVTNLTDLQRAGQKNKAQHNAPMFWVDQFNPAAPRDFRMQLTNLGLALRPDLFDAHTIHWHGFRNVITFFDGEPTGSVAVTTGRTFQYIYRPRDPGTYMFHCHVEDVEHVHMGMTGPVFVRPLQNGTNLGGFTKFAYNDGDGSTGYHREFAMFCSEVWGDSHWADAHIQLPEWSDYRADFCLLNGRVFPDTLAPNAPINAAASINTLSVATDADGDLVPNAGYEHLQYQPLSALVTCNAGERVLLRFANLGFRESAMTLAGIRMRVVGKDATPMKGRTGADTSYEASTVSFGAGESIDAIFTAPAFSGGSGSSGQGYDTYVLYDRAYERSNNLAAEGAVKYGGRQTEVRVYPSGTRPAQQYPNDHGAV